MTETYARDYDARSITNKCKKNTQHFIKYNS